MSLLEKASGTRWESGGSVNRDQKVLRNVYGFAWEDRRVISCERNSTIRMKDKPPANLRDGAQCKVVGGTHEGKSGTVRDIKTGKTGYVSITVVQSNGERFKTLAKNVVIQT